MRKAKQPRKGSAKEPSEGGMTRFIPTEDERALVKLLIANGYAQHLVCKCIGNRRGSHISESTLKRAFAHELKAGKVELDTIVLGRWTLEITDWTSLLRPSTQPGTP